MKYNWLHMSAYAHINIQVRLLFLLLGLEEVRVDDHGAVQVLLKLPQKRGAYRESDAASAGWHFLRNPRPKSQIITVGALIIRIGFWGPVYYTYKRKPPKQYY